MRAVVAVKNNRVRTMILRKLEREEHVKTRGLWEEVFKEDTKEFLDYYYSVKVADNEIYVIEDDGKIVSMLHLNPYQMRIKSKIYKTHYIVAVATDENYRKRGYMAALLNHVMQVMVDREEPFTFLMPVAEAIYKPFGFKFVYTQVRGMVQGRETKEPITFEYVTEYDCQDIADFTNEKLKEYDIVTWRDESYYKTLLEELKSENGGILMVKREGKLEAVLCFTKGERIEIREPLFCRKEDLEAAVYYLNGNEEGGIFCIGYGTHSKPMIMAKALNPKFEEVLKSSKVFLNEVV